MKIPSPPSPVSQPNAFAGLSSGTVAALIVYELDERLGVTISVFEAGFIVAFVTTIYLALGKKRK